MPKTCHINTQLQPMVPRRHHCGIPSPIGYGGCRKNFHGGGNVAWPPF